MLEFLCMEEQKFSWREKEFVKIPKNKNWLVGAGLFFGVVLILSLLIKNYFLGFLILVAGFSFFIYALKEPREYTFTVNQEGVKIDDKLIPFREIRFFWVFKRPHPWPDELSLVLKRKINSHVMIPLGEQEVGPLTEFLKKHIKEKRQEESLVEVFLRKIGF